MIQKKVTAAGKPTKSAHPGTFVGVPLKCEY